MAFPFKLGLKLWSTNVEFLSQLSSMYTRASFDYVELYLVPGTSQKIVEYWNGLEIPIVIHAPHFSHGFNLADKTLAANNLKILEEVLCCADMLKVDTIIVHGGNGGDKNETIRQLKLLKDPRLLIENKPKMGLNGKECIGYMPEEIEEIVFACGLRGFVLDFNHAVCAARSLDIDPLKYISEFLAIAPRMFHFGNGDYFSLVDKHMHLDQGNMPLNKFMAFLPKGTRVTLETPNDFSMGVRDFKNNRAFLNRLCEAR